VKEVHVKTLNRILAAAGLLGSAALVASLSAPADTAAFTTIGGTLGTAQRDFRVFDNFTDTQAHNNTVPQSGFPGHTGAVMAIWKGHVEWASEPYAGTGEGDGVTTNPILGSGGGNFDSTFQGLATVTGGTNDNIHSELSGSSGGVLAFTETPISDGWRIRYYSSWTWQDGPGTVSSGIDLQGVACHEFGHALGLGHTGTSGATMFASISGTGTAQRSIESDDIAGVQSLYGVKSATKPHIGSISGSLQIGETLTITGSNFSTTGNEVWFTELNGDGVPVKVTGVASTGGGTQIQVTIPSGVQDGDVLVKGSGTGGATLSNAWPIDVGAPAGDPPFVSGVSPNSGPAGGFTSVGITGTGLSGATSVTFEGVPAISFIVNSSTSITATSPPGTLFTLADVAVTDPEGSSTLPDAFLYSFNPAPSISTVEPATGTVGGGAEVTISGASVVGVTDVQFDGVSGTALEIVSATTLTVLTPAGAAGPVDVTAIGSGSSTITDGFTYVNFGGFVNVGPGKGSILGVPSLTGEGDLSAGSGTGFTLTLSGAFPLKPAYLFVGLSSVPTPFKGGTFYPLPILTSLVFATSGTGQVVLPGAIPAGTPSVSFVLQYWIEDTFATFGVTASNGLQATMP
jgi:hypothetical protein